MSAGKKWDVETTMKFIQLYKQQPCLWNFSSPQYKSHYRREAAYNAIAQDMNINGFNIQEVKIKIKNLRSTYNQEKKKMEESRKSGVEFGYISKIRWLKEMEEVFAKNVIKNEDESLIYENEMVIDGNSCRLTKEDPISLFSNYNQELPMAAFVYNNEEIPTTSATASTFTFTPTASETEEKTRREEKKRTKDIVTAIYDLKKLLEDITFKNETIFDAFGKSVAVQLKHLSEENALLAQSKIQNILTEYGIQEIRQRTASHSSKELRQTTSNMSKKPKQRSKSNSLSSD